jgi:hypothetical protein
VIYLFPANKVKLQGKVFSKFGAVNWDKELLALEGEHVDNQTGEFDEEEITTMLMAAPALVENEDGEEAIMMMEANIMPIELEEISAERRLDDLGNPVAETICYIGLGFVSNFKLTIKAGWIIQPEISDHCVRYFLINYFVF